MPHPWGAASRTTVHRIERASADVHRFVAQRVANRADAADISQETLLTACAKLSTFRGENLHAWLFAIARNLIIDYYRSQARFQFITVEPLAAGETEPALRIPPEDVLSECEFREHLNAWLDCCTRELELEQQVAVLQSDVYDYRDKDSAEMLRMSVPSFKLLLHSARARLKEIGSAGRHVSREAGTGSVTAAPPAQVRYRLGVNSHLGTTELVALKRKLMDGLRMAAFYSLVLLDDLEIFELLDLLVEL
jgi:RNA polymerase sigma-70 factor (ECF subfamily)